MSGAFYLAKVVYSEGTWGRRHRQATHSSIGTPLRLKLTLRPPSCIEELQFVCAQLADDDRCVHVCVWYRVPSRRTVRTLALQRRRQGDLVRLYSALGLAPERRALAELAQR